MFVIAFPMRTGWRAGLTATHADNFDKGKANRETHGVDEQSAVDALPVRYLCRPGSAEPAATGQKPGRAAEAEVQGGSG